MANKKKARKEAAVAAEAPPKSGHILMVPLDEATWNQFTAYRARRREARDFPWTVRDCMAVAVSDYLANYDEPGGTPHED